MERHFTDGTEPTILPHYSVCGGSCNQGREPCPHPLACQVPLTEDEEPDFHRGERLVLACIVVGVGLVALGAVLGVALQSLR